MDGLSWSCLACGSCCRNVGGAVLSAIDIRAELEIAGKPVPEPILGAAEFQYDILSDGSCSKLGSDGRCTIYDTRPDICRAQVMYDKHWSKTLTDGQWAREMTESCNMHREALWK